MTIDQVYILNMYLFSCNQKDLLNYGPYIHTIAISEETRSLLFILQGEPSNSLKAACMGVTQAMFPLIFKVSVHMKFLLCNILPGLVWIWNDVYEIVAKAFLEGIFMCAPCFLVCARLTTCMCASTRAQLKMEHWTQVKKINVNKRINTRCTNHRECKDNNVK